MLFADVAGCCVSRQEENTKQVMEERGESCSHGDTQPLTKHVHPSEENVDKACLNDSRNIQVSDINLVHPPPSSSDHQTGPINDGEWNDIEATEARIADVREIAPDNEGNSLDIPVFLQPNDTQQESSMDSYHQP